MHQSASSNTDQHSRDAAVALGLALPGDTLLYLILPMFAPAFGVSLFEAGMLLAANRLVRIAGYGWVARLYAHHGDRLACSWAMIMAALCALGYATLSGFVALLVLRLMWGLSFAVLNLAAQALATAQLTGAAHRSGRSRAMTALGPMLALPLGAASAYWFGPKSFFFLLSLVALAGLFFTLRLPATPHGAPQAQHKVGKLPNSLDVWSLIEGLVLDGLFIIGLSYLALGSLPGNPVIVAGLLLASRYLAEILFGSAGGRIAEHFGAEKMLLVLSVLTALALLGFGLGWLWVGALAIMMLRALMLPLPPALVALRTPGTGRIQALATRSVWRDIGAGIGPVLTSLLLPIAAPVWIYGASALLLSLAALACYKQRVH